MEIEIGKVYLSGLYYRKPLFIHYDKVFYAFSADRDELYKENCLVASCAKDIFLKDATIVEDELYQVAFQLNSSDRKLISTMLYSSIDDFLEYNYVTKDDYKFLKLVKVNL